MLLVCCMIVETKPSLVNTNKYNIKGGGGGERNDIKIQVAFPYILYLPWQMLLLQKFLLCFSWYKRKVSGLVACVKERRAFEQYHFHVVHQWTWPRIPRVPLQRSQRGAWLQRLSHATNADANAKEVMVEDSTFHSLPGNHQAEKYGLLAKISKLQNVDVNEVCTTTNIRTHLPRFTCSKSSIIHICLITCL